MLTWHVSISAHRSDFHFVACISMNSPRCTLFFFFMCDSLSLGDSLWTTLGVGTCLTNPSDKVCNRKVHVRCLMCTLLYCTRVSRSMCTEVLKSGFLFWPTELVWCIQEGMAEKPRRQALFPLHGDVLLRVLQRLTPFKIVQLSMVCREW